jgi:hypothetical protein
MDAERIQQAVQEQESQASEGEGMTVWYNCSCRDEQNIEALCFSSAAGFAQSHIARKAPSMCGLTSSAVRLDNGSTRGGRFVMGKSNEKFRPNQTCDVCGKPFYVRPCQILKGQGKYCSNQCAGIRKRGRSKVEKICEVCGRTFEVEKRKAKSARFCSRQCTNAWKSKAYQGENNVLWRGGQVALVCKICEKQFFVDSYRFESSKCCSYECNGKWQSIHRTGENSPTWQGGISFEPYPKTFNRAFKQLIRDRDNYTCATCGNSGNSVHHINYVKGDTTPENCITLCNLCHIKTNFNRSYWQSFFENLMKQRGFAK